MFGSTEIIPIDLGTPDQPMLVAVTWQTLHDTGLPQDRGIWQLALDGVAPEAQVEFVLHRRTLAEGVMQRMEGLAEYKFDDEILDQAFWINTGEAQRSLLLLGDPALRELLRKFASTGDLLSLAWLNGDLVLSLDGGEYGHQLQTMGYHAERAARLGRAFQAAFASVAEHPAFSAARPTASQRALLAKRAPTGWRGTTFMLVGVFWVFAALGLGCMGLAAHNPDWLPAPAAMVLVFALAFGPVILLYRVLQPPRGD